LEKSVFSDLSSTYNECFPAKQFTNDRKRTNTDSITSPSSKRTKYNQSTTDKLLPSLLEKCSMDTDSDSFRQSKTQSPNPLSPIKSPYEYKSRTFSQAAKYNHTPHLLDSILESDDTFLPNICSSYSSESSEEVKLNPIIPRRRFTDNKSDKLFILDRRLQLKFDDQRETSPPRPKNLFLSESSGSFRSRSLGMSD